MRLAELAPAGDLVAREAGQLGPLQVDEGQAGPGARLLDQRRRRPERPLDRVPCGAAFGPEERLRQGEVC